MFVFQWDRPDCNLFVEAYTRNNLTDVMITILYNDDEGMEYLGMSEGIVNDSNKWQDFQQYKHRGKSMVQHMSPRTV